MHSSRPITALGVVGAAEIRRARSSARDVWSVLEDPANVGETSPREGVRQGSEAFIDRFVGIAAAVAIVGVALLAVAGSPLP